MSWTQYEIYKNMIISRNNETTPLYEGDLKVAVLDSRVFNILSADVLNNSGSYSYSTDPSYNTWDYYQYMVSQASDYVKHTWMLTMLPNVGDELYYYYKTFGKSFAMVVRRGNDDGTLKTLYFGIIYNGTKTVDTVNATYVGVNGAYQRAMLFGVLIDPDNHWAYPWIGRANYRPNNLSGASCSCRCWPSWGTSQWNNFRFGYYAMFSGYWASSDPVNPYEGGGYSEPGGGDPNEQNFNEESDDVQVPALPIYSATGSGMVTAYVPTIGEINALANYLIDPNVLQAIGRVVVDMSELIISLAVFPFQVPASGHKDILINMCGVHLLTGVDSHYADGQFVQLDLGSVDIKKRWDNCLDYDPYTKISIFLPFCGFFDLDTDEVMGKNLHLYYNIDIFSGSCVAIIKVDNCVMYQFAGNCASQIPISSVSFDSMISSAIQIGICAATAGGAILGAGAALESEQASALSADMADDSKFMESLHDNGTKLLNCAASEILNAKGQYSHAGAMSAAPGFLGVRKPFIIKKVPKQSIPEGYSKYNGYPSNMKATLGNLSGYTVIENIQLNIPDATVGEIVECEKFLKGGVVL